MRDLLCLLVWLYLAAIIVRAILSWFPMTHEGALARMRSGLFAITEPVLGPLRRVIPPLRVGGAAIDLSVIVVLVAARFLVLPFVC